MQHLCSISHISLFNSPGLHNHCENSHNSASGVRVRQFQRGMARLQDHVQVRQATLHFGLSVMSGLARNPAIREIASSSGESEHQDIFFFDFSSIFFSCIFSKNLKNMISLDRKCLNIHSHLDLKSLSFSTESTNVLLPTP